MSKRKSQNFKVKLDISISEFLRRIKKEVEYGHIATVSALLRNSNQKDFRYYGVVEVDSMKIKKRNVGGNQYHEVITARFKGDDFQTEIWVRITAYTGMMRIWRLNPLMTLVDIPKVKEELVTVFENIEASK